MIAETGPIAAARPNRSEQLVALACLALGAILRFRGLGVESLWLDEGFSRSWALLSPRGIIAACAGDVQGPLYYIVLHGWIRLFGDGEAALRSLSALLSTATLLPAWSLARRLLPARAALAGLLLLAVAPLLVLYAREARTYALLALLATVSWLLLVRVLERRGAWPVALHAVVTALMLHAHPHAAFVVLAQVMHAGLATRGERAARGRAAAALGGAALLAAPWTAVMLQQAARFQGTFWAPRPDLEAARLTLVGFGGSAEGTLLLVALVAVAVLGARAGLPPVAAPGARRLLLLWLLVPIVVPFLLSQVVQPLYLTRTTLPALVAAILLAAGGLEALRRRSRLLAACVLALWLVASATTLYRIDATVQKEPWREVTTFVENHSRPGELVLFDSAMGREHVFEYYARRTDLLLRDAQAVRADPTPADLAAVAELVAHHERAWLVRSHSLDDRRRIGGTILRTHRLLLGREGNGLELYLFEKRSPPPAPGGP